MDEELFIIISTVSCTLPNFMPLCFLCSKYKFSVCSGDEVVE